MSELIAYMMAENIKENRRNTKLTICHRPGGTWGQRELSLLVNNLKPMTEAVTLGAKPEYMILFGHYTKDDMKHAGGGGLAWTVEHKTGADNLPFNPF